LVDLLKNIFSLCSFLNLGKQFSKPHKRKAEKIKIGRHVLIFMSSDSKTVRRKVMSPMKGDVTYEAINALNTLWQHKANFSAIGTVFTSTFSMDK